MSPNTRLLLPPPITPRPRMWASWLDHSYYGSASHTEVGKVLVNSWPWSNKWRLWIQEQIAWRFSWGFTWCEQRIGWSVLYIFYLLYLTLDVISATNTSLWCFFTKTVCHRSYSCISIPIHWASSHSRKNILYYASLPPPHVPSLLLNPRYWMKYISL